MARVEIIITDMGTGGAYCSTCGYCLDGGDPLNEIPKFCEQCKEELTYIDNPFINMGGSD